MKPLLDISSKNSFTVWESCVWRSGFSSSVLVSDQDSNKMQVIYDRDASRSSAHALFYANVGNVLAGCFVTKSRGKTSSVRVELLRIETLTTKTVQGNTVPEAKLAPIHLNSSPCSVVEDAQLDEKELDRLIGPYEDRPSLPNARELMRQAILKAMTLPEQQHLFWGIPRQKVEEDY